MKIIKVTSCADCPYLKWEMASDNCRSSVDRYDCDHSGRTLAKENLKLVVRPSSVNPITQEITKEIIEWVYSADGKTEWDVNKIPESCQLQDDEDDNT